MADTLFSQLPLGSFDKITIPVISVRIRTGSAAAFHKYPYRAGVDIEYTGREPVTGVMTAAFFNGLGVLTSEDLWPGAINLLRQRAQEQRSCPLVIPPLGTLPKAKIDLEEDYDGHRQDGCFATINFVEDSKDDFVKSNIQSPTSRAKTSAKAADTALATLKIDPALENESGLRAAAGLPANNSDGATVFGVTSTAFSNTDADTSATTDFATFLSGILYAYNSAQDRLADFFTKIDIMVERAKELLDTAIALKQPQNWPASLALRQLIVDLRDIKDTFANDVSLVFYRTRGVMSASAVSVATHNTVDEILSLNVFGDANTIPDDSLIIVYQRS